MSYGKTKMNVRIKDYDILEWKSTKYVLHIQVQINQNKVFTENKTTTLP